MMSSSEDSNGVPAFVLRPVGEMTSQMSTSGQKRKAPTTFFAPPSPQKKRGISAAASRSNREHRSGGSAACKQEPVSENEAPFWYKDRQQRRQESESPQHRRRTNESPSPEPRPVSVRNTNDRHRSHRSRSRSPRKNLKCDRPLVGASTRAASRPQQFVHCTICGDPIVKKEHMYRGRLHQHAWGAADSRSEKEYFQAPERQQVHGCMIV